jgi:hypothetical protein
MSPPLRHASGTARRLLFAAAVLLHAGELPAQSPAGPPDSMRTALARELIDTLGVGQTMLEGITVMTDLSEGDDAMPAAVGSALRERAAEELPALLARMSALYAERFTTEELRALLAFHGSPLARRFTAVMGGPEAQRQGELWMMDLMGQVMQDLSSKGVTIE